MITGRQDKPPIQVPDIIFVPRRKSWIKYCLGLSLQPCPSHFAFLVRPSTVLAGSSLAVYKHLLPFIFFSPVAQREVKDLPTMQERQEMGI